MRFKVGCGVAERNTSLPYDDRSRSCGPTPVDAVFHANLGTSAGTPTTPRGGNPRRKRLSSVGEKQGLPPVATPNGVRCEPNARADSGCMPIRERSIVFGRSPCEHMCLRMTVALVLWTCVPPEGEAAAPFWPEFHGPGRDNMSTETGLLTQWPEGGPPRCWSTVSRPCSSCWRERVPRETFGRAVGAVRRPAPNKGLGDPRPTSVSP